MACRAEIVDFLDSTLAVREVPDPYCPNGLQVEGCPTVNKIGFAVDACQESFQALSSCQMIITHHGLFWPSIKKISGAMRESLTLLLSQGISLYPVHLPLDVHPVYGNNAQLIQAMGWQIDQRFDAVGWTAKVSPSPLAELADSLQTLLDSPIRTLAFGDQVIERVAVSSGGASLGTLNSAHQANTQLLITGEASHPLYHAAKEMGINVILAGHYATETWGLKSLMPLLAEKFSVETEFFHCPTGF